MSRMRKLLTPGDGDAFELSAAHSRRIMDVAFDDPAFGFPQQPLGYASLPAPFRGGGAQYRRLGGQQDAMRSSFYETTRRGAQRSPSVPPADILPSFPLGRSNSGLVLPQSDFALRSAEAPARVFPDHPITEDRRPVNWRAHEPPEAFFTPPVHQWGSPTTELPPTPMVAREPPSASVPRDPQAPPWTTPPEPVVERRRDTSRAPPPSDPIYWPSDAGETLSDHWAQFAKVKAREMQPLPENQRVAEPASTDHKPPLKIQKPLHPILSSSSGSNIGPIGRRRDAPHVRFEGKREVFYITPNASPSPMEPSWRGEEEADEAELPQNEIDTSSLRADGPIVWPPRKPEHRGEAPRDRGTVGPRRVADMGEELERVLGPKLLSRAKAAPPVVTMRRPTLPDLRPEAPKAPAKGRLVVPSARSPSPEPDSEYHEARSSWLDHNPAPLTHRSSNGGGAGEMPRTVKAYDDIVTGPLAEFLALSAKIGGQTAEVGKMTEAAFIAQRDFVWTAQGMTKAAGEGKMASLLEPTSGKIQAIQALAEANRRSAEFNHLSAVSEGIPALGWVTMAPTPAPFVKEMSDASMFYTNRVLKEHKDKDQTHVDWVKAWLSTLRELQAYVKASHTTGLEWNSAPGSAPASSGSSAPPPRASGGAPPPPPPPPGNLLADMKKSGSGASGGEDESKAALFADLNKGLDITKSLKKVTDDMKTHKNPELKASSVVPAGPPKAPPKPAHLTNGGHSAPAAKPPITVLEGKKWVVENHRNNKNIVIEADMKQVVYIWKCEGSVIVVKGKVNSITMDSCKKTSIVFDSLVSQMEIINSQSVQVQSLGQMPTLAIQKTDGCQVYLSPESVGAEIVTSKSSEMNILVPGPDGDFVEFAVPEQYKTTVSGKGLTTVVVDV